MPTMLPIRPEAWGHRAWGVQKRVLDPTRRPVVLWKILPSAPHEQHGLGVHFGQDRGRIRAGRL